MTFRNLKNISSRCSSLEIFSKYLLEILNKPCTSKTISRQNKFVSKLTNVSHLG